MIPLKRQLQGLKGYTPNEVPYRIKLDANEGQNIFSDRLDFSDLKLNLYPDNQAVTLKQKIADTLDISPTMIIPGNGSSECIELILKSYIEQKDVVLSISPSFSMYAVFSQIYGATFLEVKSRPDFTIDFDKLIATANQEKAKIIFLCSPNNPTGLTIPIRTIERVIQETEALVVIDEAYIDFAKDNQTFVPFVKTYERAIVLRSLSKSYGLAGIRLGYMVANETIINALNSIRAPYHLNQITQAMGVMALNEKQRVKAYLDEVKSQRQMLYQALVDLHVDVLPSEANFVFFRYDNGDLFKTCLDRGILIRAFQGDLKNYVRVSIGTKKECDAFIAVMKEVINHATS